MHCCVRRTCLPFVTLSLISESAVTFPVEVASYLVAQVEVRVGTLFDSLPPCLFKIMVGKVRLHQLIFQDRYY